MYNWEEGRRPIHNYIPSIIWSQKYEEGERLNDEGEKSDLGVKEPEGEELMNRCCNVM